MGDGKSHGKGKGHDKDKGNGKGKGKNKDAWCTEDLDWDEDGCLYIKNHELAQQIYDAIWVNKHFCITMGDENFDPRHPEGGGGDNKMNAMCPC